MKDNGFNQELFDKWLRDKSEKNLKTDFEHLASDYVVEGTLLEKNVKNPS